jgi:hypothetical protein
MRAAMMGTIKRYVGLALVLSVVAVGTTPAVAQSQTLSDESVRKLMDYAWAQTPPRFTKPDNTVVEIDIKKPDTAFVPVDVAREVIIAARRSALAQICKLDEHQAMNYRSLMFREVAKKKWSEQQIVFINMLHLTTVQIFSGDITIKVKDDGGKVIEETPVVNKRAQSCTDAEAAKLKEQIDTYVAAGPQNLEAPAGKAAAAPTQAPAPAPTATGSTPAAKPAATPAGKAEKK